MPRQLRARERGQLVGGSIGFSGRQIGGSTLRRISAASENLPSYTRRSARPDAVYEAPSSSAVPIEW